MLQITVDWLLYGLLRLPSQAAWAKALNFFLYDSLKISLLLFVMIAAIGFLRTFLPLSRVKKLMLQSGLKGNFFAALLGAVTPFCSCSSIPIFITAMRAAIPLGIAFSFLIASPLINEYLVVLMLGFFGWKITAAYVVSGMAIGIFSGVVLGKMKLDKYLVSDVAGNGAGLEDVRYNNFRERLAFGVGEARDILRKIWVWVLVGVGLGALIHNYVPQEMVHTITSRTGVLGVPMAVLLGVPMYGGCAAIVPVAVVLFNKGFPLGTALAFMMAVAALSLPEAVMLRRVMRLQLIGIFFGVTALAIVFTGYLFNILAAVLM